MQNVGVPDQALTGMFPLRPLCGAAAVSSPALCRTNAVFVGTEGRGLRNKKVFEKNLEVKMFPRLLVSGFKYIKID